MASVLKDVMFLYYIDHNVFNLICFYGFPFITGFHQFDYDMLWYYFVCVCVCVCLSAWVSLSYLAVWFYGFNQIWEKKKTWLLKNCFSLLSFWDSNHIYNCIAWNVAEVTEWTSTIFFFSSFTKILTCIMCKFKVAMWWFDMCIYCKMITTTRLVNTYIL